MIEITNIHRQLGGIPILRGASLTVGGGEVSVLLGPSGSGKTTLLRTVNGLERFEQGTIRIGDLELAPLEQRKHVLSAVRKRVGMVFQQFHLFPHLSVLQNVTEAPRRVGRMPVDQANQMATELLRRVGLESKSHARPTTLSGGQQQRVAIVRALAMSPDVILFDEPTSALDPKMTAEVCSVIQDLAREGQTMLVVTHAIEFARRVGHTLHVMHQGRIIESGPAEQVLESPQHPSTREYLAESCVLGNQPAKPYNAT